jgi:LysM repeat protein
MNTENQSPLVPQGSLEQKNQGRARVKLVVSIVLAVHGIILIGLLMAGCQKEKEPTVQQTPPPQEEASANTNAAPALDTPTNAAAADTNTAPTSTMATTPSPTPEVPPTSGMPAPMTGTTDYKIASGDTISSIAKKNHVTSKALMEANPGIQPTKLQIGQTIKLPAPTAAAPTTPTATAGAPAATASGDGSVYEVKSGDTLSTIAKKAGVSIRALQAANNLKTTRITVGQKLKLPAKTTPTATPTTPTTAPATPPTQ